jgi:uncharacterized protein (DUF2147 family)
MKMYSIRYIVKSIGLILGGFVLAVSDDVSADRTVPAEAVSPVGLWKTFDAEGKVESLVEIRERNGELHAIVLKVLSIEAKEQNHTLCTWCKGSRKNQPLVGMTIMGNMKKEGDAWSGGWIFDPKRDLTAKCKLEVLNGGRKLKVRGYLTFFLGETRYWKRIR